MAQTAGTFMSKSTLYMASLSCRLDALADSVSRTKGKGKAKKKHTKWIKVYLAKDNKTMTVTQN